MGYFPSEAPKYTIAVVIQNSNESKLIYGADVSGRVFKEISDKIYSRYLSPASFNVPQGLDSSIYKYAGSKNDLASIFNYLNISFQDSSASGYWRTAYLLSNKAGLKAPPDTISGSVTPDVAGMGLKDAVDMLENKGFKISVNGRGRVMNQSIAAGTSFKKGQKIILMLN